MNQVEKECDDVEPPMKKKKTRRERNEEDRKVNAFHYFLIECCKTNDLSSAIQEFDRIKADHTILISSEAFGNLISLCCGMNDSEVDFEKALEVFELAIKRQIEMKV